MKKMRVAALFLCLCLLFGLLGAGSAFADTAKGKTETGKTEAEKADAPKKEVPVEGSIRSSARVTMGSPWIPRHSESSLY